MTSSHIYWYYSYFFVIFVVWRIFYCAVLGRAFNFGAFLKTVCDKIWGHFWQFWNIFHSHRYLIVEIFSGVFLAGPTFRIANIFRGWSRFHKWRIFMQQHDSILVWVGGRWFKLRREIKATWFKRAFRWCRQTSVYLWKNWNTHYLHFSFTPETGKINLKRFVFTIPT